MQTYGMRVILWISNFKITSDLIRIVVYSLAEITRRNENNGHLPITLNKHTIGEDPELSGQMSDPDPDRFLSF